MPEGWGKSLKVGQEAGWVGAKLDGWGKKPERWGKSRRGGARSQRVGQEAGGVGQEGEIVFVEVPVWKRYNDGDILNAVSKID